MMTEAIAMGAAGFADVSLGGLKDPLAIVSHETANAARRDLRGSQDLEALFDE